MKIVVMSDTHLSQLTDEFCVVCDDYCRDADLVIHLGDVVGGSVLDYLERYPLEAVAGNMDPPAVQDRLPPTKILRLGRFRVGLAHGWGAHHSVRARLAGLFTNVDAILFGHTHEPMQLEEDGIFWFNPGSVSLGRGTVSRSMGILRVNNTLAGEIITL